MSRRCVQLYQHFSFLKHFLYLQKQHGMFCMDLVKGGFQKGSFLMNKKREFFFNRKMHLCLRLKRKWAWRSGGTNNSYLSKLHDQSSQRFQRLLLKENKQKRKSPDTQRSAARICICKFNRGKKLFLMSCFSTVLGGRTNSL